MNHSIRAAFVLQTHYRESAQAALKQAQYDFLLLRSGWKAQRQFPAAAL